ncbi:MAG TPA: hypothetical protein VLH86_04200 [Patescibacteria group bacterium]|nr:hypothetical protein [Patescibacteria group bacterium]
MIKQKQLKRHYAMAVLSLLCVFGMSTAAADTLQAVVQSYSAATSLQRGMIVKFTNNDSSKVEPATLSTAQKMQGVVVSAADAAVTLSPANTSNQQTFVATSGRYEVLVSSQNGAIGAGDYVSVSSLAGVGMKADNKVNEVLGKAAGSFDGVHNVNSSTSVKTDTGKQLTVSLGLVPVDIAIAPNPIALKVANVPSFLQRASLLVANKPVSPWRIYTAFFIVLASTLLAGSLLYGGVRNGMVAIGRNPLARPSIMRNLLQIILTSVIIFIIGLFGVYLLLKL